MREMRSDQRKQLESISPRLNSSDHTQIILHVGRLTAKTPAQGIIDYFSSQPVEKLHHYSSQRPGRLLPSSSTEVEMAMMMVAEHGSWGKGSQTERVGAGLCPSWPWRNSRMEVLCERGQWKLKSIQL